MYQKQIEAVMAAWNEGNLGGLDAVLAPNVVRKAPASLKSDAGNLAGFKQVVTDLRTAFPDAHVSVDETLFMDNRSVNRWVFTGTNSGSGNFPPTGKKVRIPGVSVARYEGGKMTEELVYFDAMEMFVQLGLMAAPPV